MTDPPPARIRLTEDAIADLHRLQKKDPQILRDVFAKMILLERSPSAGEPLLGDLVPFRKLVVGNRHWRIIWRQTTDESHQPILEIAEVWAVGARSDDEIYLEMKTRSAKLKENPSPVAKPLIEVIEALGKRFSSVPAHPEPEPPERLPAWLAEGLRSELHLNETEIGALTQDQAHQMMIDHWSRRK